MDKPIWKVKYASRTELHDILWWLDLKNQAEQDFKLTSTELVLNGSLKDILLSTAGYTEEDFEKIY